MKKILFLLLLTVASYGQTYQNPTFGTVKTMTAPTVTTPTYLGTLGTDGTNGKIPSSYIEKTANKQNSLTTDGTGVKYTTVDAVNTGLDLKIDRTSTALISGCTFVNNGATFTINPGVFQIIDNSTIPYTKTTVNFLGVTNVTPLYFRTILYINSSGNVIQVNGATGDLTPLQRRDNLFISTFAYTGSAIVAPQFTPSIDYDASGRLFDLAETLGARNRDGNIIAINGANLQLNKGAGHTYRAGSNYATNKKVPDVTDDSAIIPIPGSPNLIGYRNGSGGWTYEAYTGSLTPTFWDNGTGTKATVTNNRFTIPRLYFFNGTNTFVIYLGQTEYNSLDAAKGAIYTETRTVDPATSLATHRASIPIEKGATSLSTQPTLFFIENHIDSRASSGVGGSGGAQNMQSGYNNSVTPQITTSTSLGAVTIKNGSASDSNNIFQGQNIAGSNTFSVTGTGVIDFSNKQNSLTVDGTGVKIPTVDAINLELINPYTLSDNPTELFLMSDFQTNSQKLYMQASLDGKSFFSLTNKETSFISSSGVDNVRDPSIMKYNDSYYAIYTAGVMGYVQYYKIAISSDGINWTDHSTLSTSSVSPAVSWAPEWFIDSNGDVYVYFILALTDPLLGGNLVIYYSKANNIGLTSFTNPTVLPISGVSSPALDPYVIKKGSTYYLFYAREDVTFNGYIEVATSTSPITGFTVIKDENDLGFGGGFEAPNIVEYSTGLYRMYIDKYSDGSGKYYSESTDLLTWSAPVTISSNYISRHGTVIKTTDVDEIKFFLKQAFYNSAINGSNYSGLILNSPYITGVPVAPTAALSDNSTKLATTAFVQQELSTLTFQEVTTAGNTTTNDITSKSSTIINGAAGTKFRANNSGGGYFEAGVNSNATSDAYINFTNSLSVSGGDVTFSSPAFAPTATLGTNTTQIATTAFVQNAVTSGTYTPTAVDISNVPTITSQVSTYTKVGNIVTVNVRGLFTPTTAATASVFSVTLPVNRVGSTTLYIGSGSVSDAGNYLNVFCTTTSTTTANLYFKTTTNASNQAYSVTFMYDVTQ